jgi:hypothetical protein
MIKSKILLILLTIALVVLATFTFKTIRATQELRQRAVLTREIRDVLKGLMPDLQKATASTINVPADGNWHPGVGFNKARGALQHAVRYRRLPNAPDILEVQIEARKDTSLVLNLRTRIAP